MATCHASSPELDQGRAGTHSKLARSLGRSREPTMSAYWTVAIEATASIIGMIAVAAGHGDHPHVMLDPGQLG